MAVFYQVPARFQGYIRRVLTIVILLPTMPAPSFGQISGEAARQFDEAERKIVRFPPSAFPELPRSIAINLQRRGCSIPQTPYLQKPHNVIKGEFAKAGQTDWAVLCSKKQAPARGSGARYASSILVFWNGSGKAPAELSKREDRIYLQSVSANQIAFSRTIGPAAIDFILQHNHSAGNIDHQGIDDSFAEKGSTTWFYRDGKWSKLLGAD